VPILTALVLISGLNCPGAFLTNTTTVGAITSSNTLSVCVSKSQLINGSDGSLILVIGGSATSAPKCLIYPNGLSPDLTMQLLQSGHVGCWSLYPPGQTVRIINVATPPTAKIQAALKDFKPDLPRILLTAKPPFAIGSVLPLSSSANSKNIKTKLLTLPLQVRFTPSTFSWQLLPIKKSYSSAKIKWKADISGLLQVNLKVGFLVEYKFTGITTWRRVIPNIVMNALPVSARIDQSPEPPIQSSQIPRLVGGPCQVKSLAWGC
jgi:hypothetical protein